MSRRWLTSQEPIFYSAAQPRDIDLRLTCDAFGRPTGFAWRGEPGHTLAFLVRWTDLMPDRASGGPHLDPSLPLTSPMLALAREGYLAEGATIVGQIRTDDPPDAAAWDESWPGIYVSPPPR
jgi:hypothetical protein